MVFLSGELRLNTRAAEREILGFIRKTVKDAKAEGVVVGLSGGIDSAVVGALCVKALGREKVVALLLPSEYTPSEDVQDAEELAKAWGVKTLTVNISGIGSQLFAAIDLEGGRVAKGNAHARIRMLLNYYVANTLNLLVAGTGDRSEDEVGFFTKFGDGGVDFLPIAHLYKTQVRILGAALGVPEKIVRKPASPRLWAGHLASDELPADYDTLDPLLHFLFDTKLPPAAAAKRAGVGRDVVEAVLRMHRASAHKRAYPPMVRPW